MTPLTSAGLSANFVKCQYSISKSRFVKCRNAISLALNQFKLFLQKKNIYSYDFIVQNIAQY